MEKNLENKVNFLLTPDTEDTLENFFKDIFLFKLPIEIVIVPTEDYDKRLDRNSMAKLLRPTVSEVKPTNLEEITGNIVHKVYARKIKDQVSLTSIINRLLRAYYPKVSKKKLQTAAPIVENAFRCYRKLFSDPLLRKFFIELCTKNDTIFNLTDLPVKS